MKIHAQKRLAAALCFVMVLSCLSNVPLASAEEQDTTGLCEHHSVHTAQCGYQERIEGHSCNHVHDGNCGYAEASAGVPCNMGCTDTDEDGIVSHEEGCAYVPAEEGHPCTAHVHDEACGYIEAVESAPCTFVCEECGRGTVLLSAPVDAGSAGVSLQQPGSSTSNLNLSQIDIATEETTGRSFKYAITIDMSAYFDEYIAPIAEVSSNYAGKWKTGKAQNFIITLPASLFDSSLTVDWDDVLISSTGLMEIKMSSETDGIVLQGKQSSNYVAKNYAKSIVIRVPVTLAAGEYEAAAEKGSIDLSGKIISERKDDDDLSPLNFSVSHSISVIDRNNLKHTLSVANSDESVPAFEGTSWKLSDGTYTVSGTAQSYEGLSISGDVTLNLDSAEIRHTTADMAFYAPAIRIEAGSKVNLILSGSNAVEGSPGYAGIYVSEGAELTISGSGSLAAQGGDGYEKVAVLPDAFGTQKRGYWGGGAGIGGNGIWAYNDDTWIDGYVPSFGTVEVKGGSIQATGGDMIAANVGGGAGIGSGGGSSRNNIGYAISGTVNISGGVVNATGGASQHVSETGGGAGIGAGGVTGNFFVPYNNAVQVSISDGTVIATGMADGAGIGGGANVDGGTLEITGGSVTANGGHEESGRYGGAGIGGGDNGGVTSITISGGTVTATGGGAAAGIGSGNDGFVGTIDYDHDAAVYGTISIKGTAQVTAFGGTIGGAGIGAGCSYNYDNGCGSISIAENAAVYAYAGASAQAIGVGRYYEGTEDPNSLFLEDTIALWAQTRDSEYPALLCDTVGGKDPIVYSSERIYLVTNEDAEGNASGFLALPGNVSRSFTYELNGQTLTLDGNEIPAASPQGMVGNWATLYGLDEVTLFYDLKGGTGAGEDYSAQSVKAGTTVTVKAAPVRSGYIFQGWNDGTAMYQPGDSLILTEDKTLTAQWKENSRPGPYPDYPDLKPEGSESVSSASVLPGESPDAFAQQEKSPATGDQTDLVSWFVLLGVFGLGLCMMLILQRQCKNRG